MHVGEPVKLAVHAKRRHPVDAAGDVHHRLAQLIHRDEPLVDEAEDEVGAAAPADRIAVAVLLSAIENALLLEVAHDRRRDFMDVLAGQPIETVHVDAELIDRRDNLEIVLLREREVLLAAAGGDVDDAGAFDRADVGPGDHPMLDVDFGGQLVKRTFVGPAEHVGALQLARDGIVAAQGVLDCLLGEIEPVTVLLDVDVVQLGIDRGGNVGGERPGRRRPDEQRGVRLIDQRQTHEDGEMRPLLVAFGHDFVLGESRPAARAPRHHVVTLVDPAALVAGLEEPPDRVIIFVAIGVVGVVPIHPVAEPDRLGGLTGRELLDASLAAIDELGYAVGLDVSLALEADLLFDLDFDPETLAVEAILVALLFADHRLVALKQVLVGAAPGVVNAHRIVGRDRAVQKRNPLRRGVVAVQILVQNAVFVPPAQEIVLLLHEIDLGWNLFERSHRRSRRCSRIAKTKKPALEQEDGRNPRCHLNCAAQGDASSVAAESARTPG